MKKQVLIIGIILVLIFVGLSGCSSNNNNNGNNPIIPTITPKSNIQVTSKTSRTGYSGIDFCAFIDIVIHNTGNAGGSADVWAELKQDTNTARKSQTVYLNSGESDSLTLSFCELSFWSGSAYTYRVWVENH